MLNNILKNRDCFGCGVCSTACPKKTITMQVNKDGFYTPLVDEDNCIECGICLNVCAFNHDTVCQQGLESFSGAGWSNDADTRYTSTSGGIAFEIANHLLAAGYKVLGVRYDILSQSAEHIIAQDEESLKDTVGSKYIQSHTQEAFSRFVRGEKYLVVGTPCQIDSLRRYVRMKKMEQDFVLVDFFCHGVPSDLMWKKYLNEFGIENPTTVRWRDKRTGWNNSYNMVFQNDEKESSSRMTQGDLFFKFFLRNRCLGKACYDDCKYKMTSSAADIRLGDFWGAKYEKEEKGVNAVIAFTQRGKDILHELRTCTIVPESIEEVIDAQMTRCAQRPSSYSYVMEALKTGASLQEIDKIASRIELFRDEIPHKIKYYFKRIIDKLSCR